MRVGIFGGTFNPVHIEHVNIAKSAIKELNLDKLLVMPTFIPPHKNVELAPAEDRLNMLKLAFDGIDKVEVSDYEIQKGGKSYTYETAEHLKKELNAELYFIVGGDMLVDFKTWKNPERILSVLDLAVFTREDFSADIKKERAYFNKAFGKDFLLEKYGGKSASSTKIRVYNSLGLDISGMTTKSVAEYIKQNNLYAPKKEERYVMQVLPQKRLIHTAGVFIAAQKKIKELNLDREKVRKACILHDLAKYINYKSVGGFTLPDGVPEPVVHSFLGAYLAKVDLGEDDEEVIDAIRYHTSGKANMTDLGKLVFVADMVEEGRTYDGAKQLQKAYEGDFYECFKLCLKMEMEHLRNKNQPVYFETENAYNYYVKE